MTPTTQTAIVEGHQLVYDEYGSGDRVVVLLHGLLMNRHMHGPLAGTLAGHGYRVLCVDLLGHGDSDRPADKRVHSMEIYAELVITLLGRLGIESALVGGTSLGANVSLEIAHKKPSLVRALLIEMPVLENSQTLWAFVIAPLITVHTVGAPAMRAIGYLANQVPRGHYLRDLLLDFVRQDPHPSRHILFGLVFGRKAPSSAQRRTIAAPALVLAHRWDVSHAISDAYQLTDELPAARLVRAKSIIELRARPERLTDQVLRFLAEQWPTEADIPTARRGGD